MNELNKEACNIESLESVDEAIPIEEGGPIARSGFNYQDEIGVLFLLKMLEDPLLLKAHFETHDDLVLVWDIGEQRTAEYIQVKASEPGKLWSTADLCREDSPSGSIYTKSLLRDCHKENSIFRIVTLQGVNDDLKPLCFDLNSSGRKGKAKDLENLCAEIHSRSQGKNSKKKNGASYWVRNCVWDVRHDQDDITNANVSNAIRIAHRGGHLIGYEHIQDTLGDLRNIVKEAGAAKFLTDKEKKIITREYLCRWWEQRLSAALDESQPAGGKLTRKLRDAGAPEDVIRSAVAQRLHYAALSRAPKYMDDDAAQNLQSSVRAELFADRIRYLAQNPSPTPLEFLSACLDKAKAISNAYPNEASNRAEFVHGCVFDIADRCLLRFTRA